MLPFVLALALGAPPEPQFTATGTGDATPTGKLTAISLTVGAQVVSPGGAKTTVTGLVSLRKPGAAIPPLPGGVHIITAMGDRVPGTVTGGDNKALRFTHAT